MKTGHKQRTLTQFKIAPGVYLAALMSPSEVARATKARPEAFYSTLHRWTICGDVWPEIFEVLQVSLSMQAGREQVTAFSSKSGLNYALFTHQVGVFQLRYLLPLFDGKVAKCIDDIARDGRLGYSLAGESLEALVWPSRLGTRNFAPLRALCGTVPQGQEELILEEYASVLRDARDPERIPSLIEGTSVQYASVCAVGPEDLIARLAGQYGFKA